METKNKILMSMVVASISAMASAPSIAKEPTKTDDKNKQIIDLSKITTNPMNLTAAQSAFQKEIKEQLTAMLSKKTPNMKISESISILVENYGTNKNSIKEDILAEIFSDVKFGQTADSTITGGAAGYTGTIACHSACHGACHSACHGACHGARGWR